MTDKIFSETAIETVLAEYALTGSVTEAGKALRKLNQAKTTQTQNADAIIKKYRYDAKYADIFTEKQSDYTHMTGLASEKAVKLINLRLDDSIDKQREISCIIDSIAKDSELKADDKKRIILLLKDMKLPKLSELATVASVMFDKNKLSNGEATDSSEIKVTFEGGDSNEFGN